MLDQLDAVQHLVTIHCQQIDQSVVIVGGCRSSTAHDGQVAVCFCRHITAIAIDVEAIGFIQHGTDAAPLDHTVVIRRLQLELMIRVVGSSSGVLVDADVLVILKRTGTFAVQEQTRVTAESLKVIPVAQSIRHF